MFPPFPTLSWSAMLLLKERLSRFAPYQAAERDSQAQWRAFCANHSEELNEEVLDVLDRCNLAAAWERDAAFCLGLQLGLELGGLERFWEEEA